MDGCGLENGWVDGWIVVVWRMDGCDGWMWFGEWNG